MNTTFEPGPLADVERRADGDRWTLVFVRVLRHAPDRVWAALTEPAQLEAWAPFTADRDLGSTGDATLTMIDGDVAEDLAGVGASRRAADAARVHVGQPISCAGRSSPSTRARG